MSTTRGREGATGASNGYRRCAHQYIERDRATASSSRRARMSGSSSIRAAQSASRSDSFVQPHFRQLLTTDENNKPRREFSETTTMMNDSYRRATPASGQKAAPRGRSGRRCLIQKDRPAPTPRVHESFWTKGCLASVFGVPAFFPFARFSERGHVPPDEAAAPGARVCGGLGGAHAPHRKQVRARPRIVVLAPLVSEASREASARRLSRKESWHPARHRICAPDLTRALPLPPSQA